MLCMIEEDIFEGTCHSLCFVMGWMTMEKCFFICDHLTETSHDQYQDTVLYILTPMYANNIR
jgi:hypothetical protein